MQSDIEHMFVVISEREFLGAYSTCFSQQMHNRIVCTCLPFLQSGFSNVSSNSLPRQMRSRIGCTYIPFLQSVFSNEISNYLREQMNSHIGHIYAIFPLSEFSNVSSNGMPEQMHSRIGCTYIPFFQSVFSNVSSNVIWKKSSNVVMDSFNSSISSELTSIRDGAVLLSPLARRVQCSRPRFIISMGMVRRKALDLWGLELLWAKQ